MLPLVTGRAVRSGTPYFTEFCSARSRRKASSFKPVTPSETEMRETEGRRQEKLAFHQDFRTLLQSTVNKSKMMQMLYCRTGYAIGLFKW